MDFFHKFFLFQTFSFNMALLIFYLFLSLFFTLLLFFLTIALGHHSNVIHRLRENI